MNVNYTYSKQKRFSPESNFCFWIKLFAGSVNRERSGEQAIYW